MRRVPRTPTAIVATTVLLLSLPACATNPVTGEKELVLMSEAEEIRIGRDADRQIVEEIGLYEDPELAGWVEELGERMAAVSHRPDLPWTFRVLDDETVNAFALPGGFVYLTRGILTHMNSEAEVAGVLGHEIGHVTARHAVQRYTQASLAQIGLGVGSVLAPEIQAFGGLLETGLGLLFLKFSRDDEAQSDRLGIEYASRAGYDPRQLAGFFRTIERISEEEGQRLPGWLSTHPDPEDRVEKIGATVREEVEDPDRLTVGRDAFLGRLDGIIFGPDPREGVLVGSRFLHPDLRFELRFPEDWSVNNAKRSVTARAPNRDGYVILTVAEPEGGRDLGEHAEAVVAERTSGRVRAESTRIHGLPAVVTVYRTSIRGLGDVRVRDVFIAYRSLHYNLAGLAPVARYPAYADEIENAQGSFAPLSEEEAGEIRPNRIQVVRVNSPKLLAGFLEGRRMPVEEETIALINGIYLDDRLEVGRRLKLVEEGGR